MAQATKCQTCFGVGHVWRYNAQTRMHNATACPQGHQLMTERLCTLCQTPYSKKKSESKETFSQRKYCGVGCSRKAQRQQSRRFGNTYYPAKGNEAENQL